MSFSGKRVVSVILSAVLAITSISFSGVYGKAAENWNSMKSGIYADGIAYTYYKGSKAVSAGCTDSTLILEGTGIMPDMTTVEDMITDPSTTIQDQKSKQEWWVQMFEDPDRTAAAEPGYAGFPSEIYNVIVDSNEISLGEGTFWYYESARKVYLGKGVTELPAYCFGKTKKMELYVYGEVTTVDANAFFKCRNISSSPYKIHVASQTTADAISAVFSAAEIVTDLTVDDTPLRAALEKGKIQQRMHAADEYTAGSWKKLTDAITEGEAALEGGNLTEEDVTTKASALTNALSGLVSIGDLGTAIAEAEKLVETDYTATSWEPLKKALTEAKKVKDDTTSTATSEDITRLTTAITEAIKSLVSKGVETALEELETAVASSSALVESDYTAESWKTLADALATAEKMTQNSTVSEINAAKQAVINAIDALVVKYAVSSSLGEIYTGGKAVKVASGTANAEMAGAVKAKVFFDTTEQTCYNPYASIDLSCRIGAKEAYKQFVGTDDSYAVGVKHWDETLEIPEIAEGSSYEFSVSTHSWESLQTPIYTIQSIGLYDAEDNLLYTIEPEKITDKLAAAIKKAESKLEAFEAGDYTSGDIAVKDAITAAKELMEKESCLQSELDQMIADLDTAMTALVPADTTDAKKTMSETVTEAEGLKESDYTADSWKVLQDALANAKALSEDALLSEVKAADKAVQDAVKALVKADTTPTPPPVVPTKKPSSPSPAPNDKDESDSKILKKGSAFTAGALKYKVMNAVKGKTAVTVTAPKSKKVKGVTIPATVKKDGVTYKVTSISANAFKQCKKLKKVTIGKNVTSIGKNAFFKAAALKKITVKSTKLKSVGKKALKGINKKAVIKVPKAKYKKYKKLFKGKGQSKSVKIKK